MTHSHPELCEFRVSNASFNVKTKHCKKVILDNISLSARSGELLALMGPSGAGKTTLLELMTLELRGGEASGSVTLNGEPLTFELFRQQAVYVEQFDLHWGFLTCREIMQYAAQLYFPFDGLKAWSQAECMLGRLGLLECADTRVGNQFIKGLSGGQKKRLTLGVALMKAPTIMFLDEPTSGLDAASAASVTGYLKTLAEETNMIIIATIHQPSTSIFMSFDRVMFLANGREAYSGLPADVASFCDAIGHPLPPMTNPADHFLELVNSEFVGRERVDEIVALAPCGTRPAVAGLQSLARAPKSSEDPKCSSSRGSASCYLWQTWVLLQRQSVLSFRDPSLYLGRLVIFLIANSFFAVVYEKAREPNERYGDPRVRLIIWFVCAPSVFSVIAAYAANEEFKLMRVEVKNGLSRAGAFFLANLILQLPYMFALACSSLIVPWAIGSYPWVGFPQALLAMTAMLWAFESISRLMGVACRNAIVGMLAGLAIWFLCFLFMGVFLNESFISWPWRALVDMLPLKWAVHSIVFWAIHPTTFTADGLTGLPSGAAFPGDLVLDKMSEVMSSVTSHEQTTKDIGFLILIGALAQLLYIAVAAWKSHRSGTIKSSGLDEQERGDLRVNSRMFAV